MTHTSRTLASLRQSLATAVALICLLATAAPALAQPHRARLSQDLAEHLTARREAAVRVIVRGSDEELRGLEQRYGARLVKTLRGGGVLEVTGGQLSAISEDPAVAHLSGDVRVTRTMAVSATSTGADQVWAGFNGLAGVTGRGIGVAVIDSGVVAAHRSLRDRVAVSLDFTDQRGPGHDQYGHGTHVAGIIAGAAETGYTGMAPGAHIVNLKVLGADGTGLKSDVIEAIDWAIEHRAAYNIRVINLSLGGPVLEPWQDDPLCQAVERATRAGIVVVASAGNMGKTADGTPVIGGIGSPGNSPSALTVGALNTKGTPERSDDVMATYSSRGPTRFDRLLKPELAAPGNRVAAAAGQGTALVQSHPERVVAGAGANAYMELSGTSMAAAVVSGAAALLLERASAS
jgi:serine protease AprX